MHSNSDERDRASVRHRLANIVGAVPLQGVEYGDDDHRPLIKRDIAPDPASTSFDEACVEIQNFIDGSEISEEELSRRTSALIASVRDRRRANSARKTQTSNPTSTFEAPRPPKRAQPTARPTRIFYAARTADREELKRLLLIVARQAGHGAHAAALVSAVSRFRIFSTLIIERIEAGAGAQPVGLATIHRAKGNGRFFSTPLWTAFPLTPEVFACGASQVVQLAAEEVARRCTIGRLTYVADAQAIRYKSIVQATARCRFEKAGTALSASDIDDWLGGLRFADMGAGRHGYPAPADPSGDRRDHSFEVATTHITGLAEPSDNKRMQASLLRALRVLHRIYSFFGDRPANHDNTRPNIRKSDLDIIAAVLSDDPRRRLFAGGDGTQLFWASASDRIVAGESDAAFHLAPQIEAGQAAMANFSLDHYALDCAKLAPDSLLSGPDRLSTSMHD